MFFPPSTNSQFLFLLICIYPLSVSSHENNKLESIIYTQRPYWEMCVCVVCLYNKNKEGKNFKKGKFPTKNIIKEQGTPKGVTEFILLAFYY